jgi:hypothetical protein
VHVFVVYRLLVDGAHVVRVFLKELIPINFGYGLDFFIMGNVEEFVSILMIL